MAENREKEFVANLAPLLGVQDQAVRSALQSIYDRLRVREGETGTGDRRFIEWRELKIKGSDPREFSSGTFSNRPSDGGLIGSILQHVSDSVMQSKMFKLLGERIRRIETPEWFQGQFGAAIKTEQIIRQTATTALSNQIAVSVSNINGNIAIVQQELTATSNLATATASAVTQLQTDVAGVSATAQQALTLATSVDGVVDGSWTVKFDVDGYVTGAGLGLEGQGGSYSSEFMVRADRFAVGSPSFNGGVPSVPFIIYTTTQTINGLTIQPGVYMKQAMIEYVTANQIDTRGLTVKDASGNIILASGTPLTQAYTAFGVGVNIIRGGGFEDGLAGWVNGYTAVGATLIGWNLSADYSMRGSGVAYVWRNATGVNGIFDAGLPGLIPIKPSQRYELQSLLNAHRCTGVVGVAFYTSAQAYISEAVGNSVSLGSTIYTMADMAISSAFVTSPANAHFAYVFVRATCTGGDAPYLFFKNVYLGEAGPAQSALSAWTPGRGMNQITPANVSTYIANAAIGNAQIGGTIQSDNYSQGSTGWAIGKATLYNQTVNGVQYPVMAEFNGVVISRPLVIASGTYVPTNSGNSNFGTRSAVFQRTGGGPSAWQAIGAAVSSGIVYQESAGAFVLAENATGTTGHPSIIFMIDTGVTDPNYVTTTIRQAYMALANVDLCYSWWTSDPGSALRFRMRAEAAASLEWDFLVSGSPPGGYGGRLMISIKVPLPREIHANITEIAIDRINWGLMRVS